MHNNEKNHSPIFTSFEQFEGGVSAHGSTDWAVPWSDLMMVMFVLFVVLFIYADSKQDVKVLFSEQSRGEAQAVSTLDPLMGLIGQIASRADEQGSREIVRMAEKQVLYRSRADGVSVVREESGQIRVTLRGALFFDESLGSLRDDSRQYLDEIAEVIRLGMGTVHVVGYASAGEADVLDSFALSASRAEDVAQYLMTRFEVDPRRIVISGRGASHPEIPGTNAENQALNRRVEIIITN